MNERRHDRPSRLRLRFTQLKHDARLRDAVTASLRVVQGVVSVETSASSGGIQIHYDRATGSTRKFWNDIEAVLLANHLHHATKPLDRQTHAPISALGHKVAEGVASTLVNKLIERSAIALVAALL